jgi:hypothetical protein
VTAAERRDPPSAEEMRATVAALADLLERENAALAAQDGTAVRALLAEKRRACGGYEDAVRTLREAGDRGVGLPGLQPAQRLGLRCEAERLGRAQTENRRRLQAAIEARKRLLGLVAAALRESAPLASGYARGGARGRSGRSAPAPALSFDRAL